MKVNWVRTIYGPPNGRGWHVHSLVHWKGAYYIAFPDGAGHDSDDSQVRICTSTNLENWTSHIAIGQKDTGLFTSEPQLLPIGDKLFLYAVTADHDIQYDFPPHSRYPKSPSWEVMSSSKDGVNWSKPRRCYTMNYDFWHPTEYDDRYYVTCDGAGHTPEGIYSTVDLLTTTDGERWTWISEVFHGTEMPSSDKPDYPQTPYPSESAIVFLGDGRLLAITRTPANTAVLSTSTPPYEEWEHRSSQEARLKGAAVAKVGDHIVVTGRSFADERVGPEAARFNEKFSEYDTSQLRLGVYLYQDGDVRLKIVLPSGGDTGYGAILPTSDSECLIAYYSSHEYAPEKPGSNVYLASVSLE